MNDPLKAGVTKDNPGVKYNIHEISLQKKVSYPTYFRYGGNRYHGLWVYLELVLYKPISVISANC